MRQRWIIAGFAVLVMASSVPLYQMVRQEYLPSNVDEGEFDVRITTAEGTGLGRDQAKWRCGSRPSCAKFLACAPCLSAGGQRLLWWVEQRKLFCPAQPA
jgi:hypothetical protein